MKYSSVILAGGFGTRMRPLTDTVPKPMLPIGGEPNLVLLCEQLLKNGFDSAVVTLKYLPDKITALGNSCRGVDLYYVTEDEPLGTAGAVKAAAELLDDDFLVISGDSVCTLDIASAFQAHKRRGAAVTVLLHTVDHPCEYGDVVCDEIGRIVSFREKPSWRRVVSDKVNTGIYILSKRVLAYIPDGGPCDFSRDVFPRMLDSGEAMYGSEPSGYWRDIGSFSEYLAANRDMSRISGGETEGSVCGDGFAMGKNSAFINSVAFDGVKIADNCSITGSVLARNVTVGDGCVLRDGCVIGEGAVIDDGVKLGAGTVIGCGKTVTADKGDTVMGELAFENGVLREKGDRAAALCRLASAAPSVLDGPFAVTSCGRASAEAELFAGALCSFGGEVMFLGEAPEQAARLGGFYFGCPVSFVISEKDGDLLVGLYDGTGSALPDSVLRKMRGARGGDHMPGTIRRLNALDTLYYRDLTAQCRLDGARVVIASAEDPGGAAKALRRAGAEIVAASSADDGTYVINCSDGAALLSQGGAYCGFDTCLLILLALADPDDAGTVCLPGLLPDVFEKTARSAGVTVRRYSDRPSDLRGSDESARAGRTSCRYTFDPLFLSAALIGKLVKNGMSLAGAAEKYAPQIIRREEIKIPDKRKASCMRRLYEAYMPYQTKATDGVRIVEDGAEGVAAASDSDSISIVISADSEEAAEDAVTEVMMRLGRLRS